MTSRKFTKDELIKTSEEIKKIKIELNNTLKEFKSAEKIYLNPHPETGGIYLLPENLLLNANFFIPFIMRMEVNSRQAAI